MPRLGKGVEVLDMQWKARQIEYRLAYWVEKLASVSVTEGCSKKVRMWSGGTW
jgi:hypothetical protein